MEWRKTHVHNGYSVSTDGQVRNDSTGYILKQGLNTSGYRRVMFGRLEDGTRPIIEVHRLVGIAFIENPLCLETINHIDENKENNSVSNLEWMSRGDNVTYSKQKHYKLITPDGELLEICNLSKFCRDNKLSQSCMSRVLNGLRRTHKGYSMPTVSIPDCVEAYERFKTL